MTPELPDPIVTANVYCSRHLDDVLRDAIAPFRAALPDDGFLWFYRYGKRGEHLKLRLHAPAARRDELHAGLARALAPFLTAIADAPPVVRISKSALPPLDVEDAVADDHPDRALLWTQYQRSAVVVGDPIYIRDDRHMALFTRALAASADFLLAEVLPAAHEPTYLQRRQNGFLKLIVAALAATELAPAVWPTYLAYHRDWLVRHLASNGPAAVDATAIRAEIDGRVAQARGSVPALARILAAPGEAQGPLAGWSAAVRAFFEHARGYRGRPDYDRDPYTEDFAFLPLFKVLHGCANQTGLRISNEAYLHQLLHEAAVASLEAT